MQGYNTNEHHDFLPEKSIAFHCLTVLCAPLLAVMGIQGSCIQAAPEYYIMCYPQHTVFPSRIRVLALFGVPSGFIIILTSRQGSRLIGRRETAKSTRRALAADGTNHGTAGGSAVLGRK